MHSLTMDGADLLRALMARDGLNSNSLAGKLRNQSLQSHVYRYLKGVSKEPKRETLRPIAEHFHVPLNAFYDPDLAEQVAAERGLVEGRLATGIPAQPQIATTEADQLAAALEVLTNALIKADKNTRIAVEPLLASMANEPDDAGQKSRLILRLLVTTDELPHATHDGPRAGASLGVVIGPSATELLGGKEDGKREIPPGQKTARR